MFLDFAIACVRLDNPLGGEFFFARRDCSRKINLAVRDDDVNVVIGQCRLIPQSILNLGLEITPRGSGSACAGSALRIRCSGYSACWCCSWCCLACGAWWL